METLPTSMWEELEMLQIYPKSCGKRCGNSAHRLMGGVADATNLPTDMWEEMHQVCQYGKFSLRSMGRDVETLPTGLWVAL